MIHRIKDWRAVLNLVARICTRRREAQNTDDARNLRNGAAQRCTVCGGKFGLIRHYSWRTALCSKRCSDPFKAREEGDRRWLGRLQAVGHAVLTR